MPYKDPERHKQKRREWSRRVRAGSSYRVVSATKYNDEIATALAAPGVEVALPPFANGNSAGVQAWRFKQGFYGPGLTARVSGRVVYLKGVAGQEEGESGAASDPRPDPRTHPEYWTE